MENREALSNEAMKIKNIKTRKEFCRVVGYSGIDTNPLKDWERVATRRFMLHLEQYLARWHPDDLARLSSLSLVFPYLEPVITHIVV